MSEYKPSSSMVGPSQKPGTPPPNVTPNTTKPIPATSTSSGSSIPWTTIVAVIGVIAYIIFGAGAAVLSYNKFSSIFWAIIAFFLAHFYYPYYAFFYSTYTYVGGRMRGSRR